MNPHADPDWEEVFRTNKLYRAEMLKALLEEEGIRGVIINKQDSSYTIFGEIELHVKREDILRAKSIIERFSEK